MTDLCAALESLLQCSNVRLSPTVGGSICRAFMARTDDGRRAFVKTHDGAFADELFAVEADGLDWLRRANVVNVPVVLAVSADPPLLALEWVDSGVRFDPERLGRGLAALHASGAPEWGWSAHPRGYCGDLPQDNTPTPSWPELYAERRIRPLVRSAADRGLLEPSTVTRADRLCSSIERLCGPPEPRSRLHGDLWSGNVMADSTGAPWLVDPAPYGGHREVDLAMLRLFGSPSEAVFEAYGEVSPLADGWRERVALYQLYPLLVHVILFGAAYVARFEEALRFSI